MAKTAAKSNSSKVLIFKLKIVQESPNTLKTAADSQNLESQGEKRCISRRIIVHFMCSFVPGHAIDGKTLEFDK